MEFRLVYRGPLPAQDSQRNQESERRMREAKSKIRRQFHGQLKELWNSHPVLNSPASRYAGQYIHNGVSVPYWVLLGEEHKVPSLAGNPIHHFAPLITERNYNACSLDILFLRRDMPGGLVMHGGDIDNRIKVLLDALRAPKQPREVEEAPQDASEDPRFCLLADDKYIDQLSVTTDRLLTPPEGSEAIHDVVLVIHVIARLFDPETDLLPM